MPPIRSLSLLCISFLSYFNQVASSRHIHRHHMQHRHHARHMASPVFETLASSPTASSTVPSVTDGNAVIADIQEIEKGFADLPQDIKNLVLAVEQRLQQLETMLAGLISGSSTAASSIPTGVPSATYLPVPASPSLPPGVAAPPSSQITTTYTSTSTSTSTVLRTIKAAHIHANATAGSFVTGTASSRQYYYPHFQPPTSGSVSTSLAAVTSTLQYATSAVSTNVSSYAVTSTYVTYSLQPTPSSYTFNVDAEDNVAVYYGQTPSTQAGGLLALCESPDVDIAILAFVYDFFSQDGMPSVDFGPACQTANSVQQAQAPGLQNCTALAPEIAGCQQLGKKVLVSLGGATSTSTFTSDDQATQLAGTLWNLFGAGTDFDPALRPFGSSVKIDGFDIDNEDNIQTYWTTLATALRQQFSTDPSKTYYLSAAPQCPMPDASTPFALMEEADFVWVQFYNNPECNLDNANGFAASFAAWSANLTNSSTPGKPRLYIGAPAFAGAGTGYVPGAGLSPIIGLAREQNVSNFGGIMMWDGSEGMANVDSTGVDFIHYAKASLQY